jgi:hypothetical protein
VDGVSIRLIQRIREEFEEAPWRRFTVDEAAQFWALEPDVSRQILAHLTKAGFLVRGGDQRVGPRFAATIDLRRPECGAAAQLHG